MNYGRKEIFTDVVDIDENNIIEILQKAMPEFMQNASDCGYLLNYEAGDQKISRKKKYRPEIDCICNDNIANEVTEFKLAFNWGNPITLVQRGENDSGTDKEVEGISLLNECYEAQNIKSKTQQLARFIEICGIGYTYVDINMDWVDGDSYFTVDVVDPRFAFVIKSSYYIDHRPMISVTFRIDEQGNFHFTCFTRKYRFELLNMAKFESGKPVRESKRDWKNSERWKEGNKNGEKNPLGIIPVIEWVRSHDRMGCFERQMSEMDNLNLLISDFINDVDQNTQAVWHGNDIEFPEDEDGNVKTPETNDWILTQTTKDGAQPFVKPLSVEYDYEGMLNMISYRVARIKEKCFVPSRNNDNSGSTGVAMDGATGYTAAESDANKQQGIIEGCKMMEVRAVLAAIKKSPYVKPDNPLLKLRYSDMKPSIKRMKNYELSVKTTALANLINSGIYGLHAINTINLFDDNAQVWADSKELIEKHQSALFDKKEEQGKQTPDVQSTDGGYEAQIQNSPLIDGMSKEEPKKADQESTDD
jgi:SPP1 family phage portal protein